MRRITTNLFQHPNGVYYARFKRKGKQHWVSLRTHNVKDARRALQDVLHPKKDAPTPAGSVSATGIDLAQLANQVADQLKEALGPLFAARESALNSALGNMAGPGDIFEGVIPANRPEFDDAVRQYFASRTFASPSTEMMYNTETNRLLKFKIGWDAFSPAVQWKAVRATFESGHGNSSLNQFSNYLRHLCRWWRERNWITALQLREAESLTKMEVMPRDPRICTPEQMTQLLNQIQHDDQVSGWFCRFLAYSGARRQAALDLKWAHVDFESATIKLNAQKGRLTHVPIGPKLQELLIEMRDAGGIQVFDRAVPIKSDGRVFPIGNSRLGKAERLLKKWAKFYDLDITCFHIFRHYFGTRMNTSGASLHTTAKMLGHKNTNTVEKTYVHAPDDYLRCHDDSQGAPPGAP